MTPFIVIITSLRWSEIEPAIFLSWPIENLNNTLSKLDLTDIKTVPQQYKKCTFSSSAHGACRMEHSTV